jgi:hypothetical protein
MSRSRATELGQNRFTVKIYFFLFIVIFCSCTKYTGDKENTKYDRIEIYFDGNSKDFSISQDIRISVLDSVDIENLNELKNKSKLTFFANTKGSEYVIDVIFTDNISGDQLLIRIFKSFEFSPTIVYGTGTLFDRSYRNEEFAEYVGSIVNLDAIKQYEGKLSQEYYDEFILKKGN